MKQKNQNTNKIIITVSVIIIFAILGLGFYFLVSFLNKKVDEEKNRYRNLNETLTEDTEQVEENLINESISNETVVDDFNQVLDKSYGKIELVWVDSENNISATPEKPNLGGMNAVKFNRQESDFVKTDENDNDWYDYSKKQWANATDENGSYFVWIPRYAYKVIYYSDRSFRTITGYADARGILKVNGDGTLTRVSNNSTGLKEVGNHYILHPVFINDYPSGYRNGGWDSNISGIWVSKFEVSMEENGAHVETDSAKIGNVNISDIIKIVSKPGVSSWRNISISNAYYNGYAYNRERESHLMKNSEWGAVAYLTYSKYGTNSNELTANTSRSYITGNSATPSEVYNNRKDETSNGNQTGIYDLAGGAWEYVSSFINNGNAMARGYGKNLFEDLKNSKYKTIYNNDKSDNGNEKYDKSFGNANFLMNILLRGDAISEISNNGYGNYSWNTNTSFFVQQDVPFFIRGGDFASGTGAGIFSYNGTNGQASAGQSYRIILVCK